MKLVMPTELIKALAENPSAKTKMESMSPSHKREYIAYVQEAKKTETYSRRSLKVIEMLKQA